MANGSDDVWTPTIALVGLVGAIVLFALIVLLQVVYYHVVAAQFNVKQIEQTPAELSENLARQQAKLHEPPGWVDQRKGILHIPIESAMVLVVREYSPPKNGPEGATRTEGKSHGK